MFKEISLYKKSLFLSSWSSISIFFFAIAIPINSSTFIAEILAAFTCHIITSCNFFNPKLTFWTLFVSFTFYKTQKLLINFQVSIAYPVLSTCLTFMIKYLAVQTIMFITTRTNKILVIFFKEKYILAIGSWAPWNIFILINSLIEFLLTIFLQFRFCKDTTHIQDRYFLLALNQWALNIQFSLFYSLNEILS